VKDASENLKAYQVRTIGKGNFKSAWHHYFVYVFFSCLKIPKPPFLYLVISCFLGFVDRRCAATIVELNDNIAKAFGLPKDTAMTVKVRALLPKH
jgi:hypothetical protein